jgi:hypothetical protein
MAIRTPLQVRRLLWGYVKKSTAIPYGMCKRETRLAINITASKSETAREAYAETKHRFTGMWIPGALAWWKNDGAWHVAWCAFRKGYVYTVDTPNAKRWNRIPLTQVHENWPSCEFVGFSRDMDGVTVVKVPRIVRRYP